MIEQRMIIRITLVTVLGLGLTLFQLGKAIFTSSTTNANPLKASVFDGQSTANSTDAESISFNISARNAETTNYCLVSQAFPDQIKRWCGLIEQYASLHGFDPDLIAAIILQESAGEPTAYSHSGAVGLMQVMPRDGLAASFNCINGPCFEDRPSIKELEDPEFNIAYATEMLADLNYRYGNIREALRYYGPMDVGYNYTDKVLGLYERYRD